MAEARQLYPDFDITRSWELPDVPAAPDDESFEAYLTRVGFTPDQLYYTRRSWGNAAGDDIARISAAHTLNEMTDDSAGTGDYRVVDGYDQLLHLLAEGVDIRLNTVVASIAWNDTSVTVTTTQGDTYTADRILITLPLGVLQADHVRFTPELPQRKRDAIHALTMGAGAKLIFRFDDPVLPDGIMAFYSAHNPPMWWSPSFGREGFAGQVITAFVTGDWARELLADGDEAALERAFGVLERELERKLPAPRAVHVMNWSADPYALGGYSVVPPGAAWARQALAEPVADRLFWAGEATAPGAWSATVHGAYASGRRAAAEMLAHMGYM